MFVKEVSVDVDKKGEEARPVRIREDRPVARSVMSLQVESSSL